MGGMVRRLLETGSLAALATFTVLTLSAPAVADGARQAVPAANIAVAFEPSREILPPEEAPARTIRRHADGLFYVEAEANGQSIRFVVDTGATVVVLNREDAEKLGLPFDSLAGKGSIRTVGGSTDMRWAKIPRLDMAGKRIEQLNAAVIDKGLPVSLMGQNALEQLGTVTLRGDTMTIH